MNGIEAAVMFPSSGLAFDAQISRMPDAACAATRAFNRWIEEDWGFNYQSRIFAAPFISLQKIDEPVDERESLRDHPSEVFRQHVWVAPFLDLGHEAKVGELISIVGKDHVVFGSDWPHSEGRESPRHFNGELAPVSDADMPFVLHENSAGLLGLS
jgi:hypothetical protein